MKTIQKLYDYVCWANDYLLDTIHQSEDHPELLRLFSHILFSERVWLTRLQGEDSTQLVLWAESDYEQCKQMMEENKQLVEAYLSSVDGEMLSKEITYTTNVGKQFSNTVEDVLQHIALHGQYHRGQINLKLRELGYEPVNVDYLTYIRN